MTKELIEISMAEEELENGEGKILIDIPEQNYTQPKVEEMLQKIERHYLVKV